MPTGNPTPGAAKPTSFDPEQFKQDVLKTVQQKLATYKDLEIVMMPVECWCPSCGEIIQQGAHFCVACGVALVKIPVFVLIGTQRSW